MQKHLFKPIACGETLPPHNVHAVSVSMPKLQDVIDYEEQVEGINEKIKSGYPRFILHPYLKLMVEFLKKKYTISNNYEVVLLSSKKAVKIVSDKYFIHNPFEIDEPFGVILVLKETSQLQKVLMFIQHVGCNLSSRFAEDYLIKNNLISTQHKEHLAEAKTSEDTILANLSQAYGQPKENICLSPSGMNSVYAVLKGLKTIQAANGRNILVQFGWLYLDTMNIVKHHFTQTKIFYDIAQLDALENYLKQEGFSVSAIITEVPTNPLIQTVDLIRLKALCVQYQIPLVIDSTLATPHNLDLKPYGDIFVESLTKFACGNADVLMGCFILNENSKISFSRNEFFKHCDKPYIKDMQRLAYEIPFYKQRMEKINQNCEKLVNYLKEKDFIESVYYSKQASCAKNYMALMKNEHAFGGLISMTFKKPFQEVYDRLNFAKGPSLGTEFTLLMPYVYLAHYDCITSQQGQAFLKAHKLPMDLLRVSVGCENIDDIINEFEKLN
ncbi:MAG: PLP-dependent transferase [Candidatus Marinarcus sp.]|uniref:PLP-dependent transferase n=1 Tax=Candidatus Marinarcus sp. TaxID=3100987 RepID=UPI003B00FAEF